jgi:hypothetical protein
MCTERTVHSPCFVPLKWGLDGKVGAPCQECDPFQKGAQNRRQPFRLCAYYAHRNMLLNSDVYFIQQI